MKILSVEPELYDFWEFPVLLTTVFLVLRMMSGAE
jgi:hypothetical protein